jgi:hypothetical protein
MNENTRPIVNHKEAIRIATALNQLKFDAMQAGLHRTGHLIDIATQEIGWEMQGQQTPKWQKQRQQETLTP